MRWPAVVISWLSKDELDDLRSAYGLPAQVHVGMCECHVTDPERAGYMSAQCRKQWFSVLRSRDAAIERILGVVARSSYEYARRARDAAVAAGDEGLSVAAVAQYVEQHGHDG